MNDKNEIEMIHDILTWLDSNNKSMNIVSLSQALNKLSILSTGISQSVTEAYSLQNEFEDEYDIAFAKRFSELVEAKTSAAAAKPIVEAERADSKRDYTKAKNAYKKLSMYLDRLDRVADTYKQYVSNLKIDLKHS